MSFIYEPNAGNALVKVRGEFLSHFKALRLKQHQNIELRNLTDDFIYLYTVSEIDRNEIVLDLLSHKQDLRVPQKFVRIIWCGVDPKTIEKTIAQLNEIGASELLIINCARTQGSNKYDIERLQKIAIASCEQCGRSKPINIALSKTLPNEPFYLIDFSGEAIQEKLGEGSYLIGPEGGFSEQEITKLTSLATKSYKFNTNLTLKSETAVLSVATMAML